MSPCHHCENDIGYALLDIQGMMQDGWGSSRHQRSGDFSCLREQAPSCEILQK